MGLFSNNNQEALDKLRQVLNEVLVLKEEEAARSIELIKQLGALNERIDGLSTIVGTLDERQKSHTTMIELLGKKVNEIGKTVDDHFESFVKVSEKDTELFKLIAQALTGKVVEEEASAEPKLTEKATKKRKTKKKNEGAKEAASEAEKTVSGTDGDGGKERKTVVVHGKISISPDKNFFAFSKGINYFLTTNGFKYIPYPKDGFKELSFRKTMRKGEDGTDFAIVNRGVVNDALLANRLCERFGYNVACVLRFNSHYCKLSFKK